MKMFASPTDNAFNDFLANYGFYFALALAILIFIEVVIAFIVSVLKNKIRELFNLGELESSNLNYLSNSRQISLVKKSIDVLDNTLNSIENNIEIDLLAIDIKECFDLLGEIIGSTYKDELLDEIFSNFCLGK